MALVTAAGYKTSRGLTGSDHDARIAVAIPVVEAFVRDLCGRDRTAGFESATWTEVYDGTGTDTLTLREWPVASVTSIKYRDSSTTFGTAEPTTSYFVDPTTDNRGEVYRLNIASGFPTGDGIGSSWVEGHKNLQVVYVGGYSTIPGDLTEACYQLIDSWYSVGLSDQVNSASSVMGVVNKVMRTEDERAATVRRLLMPWAGALIG